MLKWLGGLLDRSFSVLGAVIFAQAPLFMQQYTQQMIGREAELRLQVDSIRQAAGISGKTIEQLAQKFMENSDPDVMRQGEMMVSVVGRWHNMSDALAAMQESTIWNRPIAFLYHLNTDAFISTLHQYKIGLPLNLEGGAYALLGIVIGYLVFAFIKALFRQLKAIFVDALRRGPQKQPSNSKV